MKENLIPHFDGSVDSLDTRVCVEGVARMRPWRPLCYARDPSLRPFDDGQERYTCISDVAQSQLIMLLFIGWLIMTWSPGRHLWFYLPLLLELCAEQGLLIRAAPTGVESKFFLCVLLLIMIGLLPGIWLGELRSLRDASKRKMESLW